MERSASPGVAARRRRSGGGLERLRSLCLALPETAEEVAHGMPAFRVRGKTFALYADDHHGDGRVAAWCKAPPGMRDALVAADATRYFSPPYLGPSGWAGVHLDAAPDWDAVADLLEAGYRMVAPKRLTAALDRDACA